jgi:hypothetical protein
MSTEREHYARAIDNPEQFWVPLNVKEERHLDTSPDTLGAIFRDGLSGLAYYDEDEHERVIGDFDGVDEPQLLALISLHRVASLRFARGETLDQSDRESLLERSPVYALNMTEDEDLALVRRAESGIVNFEPDPMLSMNLLLLAIEYAPDDYGPAKPVSVGGTKTTEIFTNAIEGLRRTASLELDLTEAVLLEALCRMNQIQRTDAAEERGDFGFIVRRLFRLDMARNLALRGLGLFEANTPRALKDQLDGFYEQYATEHPELFDVPIESTGWRVLPPEELDEIIADHRSDESIQTQVYYDWSRIRYLAYLAREVFTGGQLFVRDKGALGDDEYFVAELPLGDGPDKQVHAVADNPRGPDNAIYVWRHEVGTIDPEHPRTWQQVFIYNKRLARALGARNMRHTDSVYDRLDEYLTRPADELKNRRYNL